MIKPDQGTDDREPGPIGRREFITGTLASLTAAIGGLAPILAEAKTPSPEFRNNVTQFRWFRPQTVPRQTAFLNANGDVLSLQNFRGKTLLVNFWATWCKPCEKIMPELQKLLDEYGDKGLHVMGIAIDEGEDRVKKIEKYIQKHKISYPIFSDAKKAPAWHAYRVRAVPALFLVDQNGQVVSEWRGSVDHEALRQEVARLITE